MKILTILDPVACTNEKGERELIGKYARMVPAIDVEVLKDDHDKLKQATRDDLRTMASWRVRIAELERENKALKEANATVSSNSDKWRSAQVGARDVYLDVIELLVGRIAEKRAPETPQVSTYGGVRVRYWQCHNCKDIFHTAATQTEAAYCSRCNLWTVPFNGAQV